MILKRVSLVALTLAVAGVIAVTGVSSVSASESYDILNSDMIIRFEDEIQRDYPVDEVGSGSKAEIEAYFTKEDKENAEFAQELKDFIVNDGVE